MARYTMTLICDPARCGGAPTVGDRRIPLTVLLAALRAIEALPPRKRSAEMAAVEKDGYPDITPDEWHVLRQIIAGDG